MRLNCTVQRHVTIQTVWDMNKLRILGEITSRLLEAQHFVVLWACGVSSVNTKHLVGFVAIVGMLKARYAPRTGRCPSHLAVCTPLLYGTLAARAIYSWAPFAS